MESVQTGFRGLATFWRATLDLSKPSTEPPNSVRARARSLAELLSRFAELRRENMAVLVGLNLTGGDLEGKGLHPELGEVTLSQLLATWVVHDLDHVAQIARTMAKAYGEATGPWTAYLSILRDRV
jgi:hypothetical protein